MRMSLMFAAVTLLTGINLFFIPFQPVAGIIITLMLKGKEPGDEFRVLITVFAFLASIWYSVAQFRKENKLRS